MNGPKRIVVDLTGRAWGGVLELSHDGPVEAHVLIGSMYTDHSAFEAQSPLRMLDGRVELGRPVSANDKALSLVFVADGTPGSVTRDQTMTAVRVCALWRSKYRGERGKIPIEPSDDVASGRYRFDVDRFRALVVNWEDSNRMMREYPSKHQHD